MALQKTKELATGVSGDYTNMPYVIVDKKKNETQCTIELFKDEAAKSAGKLPLEVKSYSWSGDQNPCTIAAMDVVSSNPIKLCYAKLKTLDEFSGASDV